MMTEILELKNISKSYGETKVLNNINLKINNNEFFTILGSSGSGKSTILRMIGGFVKPTSGQIFFENKVINEQPVFERPFNTVFQDYALFPNMNVSNNVGFGLKIKNINPVKIKEKVQEVLSVVGLENFSDRMPQELSGGQQQRVALARAIICEPKVILLDEPLGALDAELRKQMQLFLKEIQKKIKISFIFITHDQEEAIFLSDKIAVLNNHKFEQIGSPKDLYYKPKTTYMAKFFGECNLIECKIIDKKNDTIKVESEYGQFCINQNTDFSLGESIIFGIRPEEIQILNKSNSNSIELLIKDIEFRGSTSNLNVKSKNNKNYLKIQNISSNISNNFQQGNSINLEFNTALGTIFKNETSS
jgi:spermidine/putrescine transport system ATP-binding protein